MLDESPPRFAAVILAAGEATRMDAPKQVLPFGRTTMVGAVLAAAKRSSAVDVVVVTGFHGDEVEAALGARVRTVRNPDAASGNMSSLLVGIDAADPADGVVILLSDMPEVTSDSIDSLIEEVTKRGARAGWVEYTNGRGHPIVLTAASIVEVRELSGPKALWSFLSSLDDEQVFSLNVSGSKPIDVNTQEDYEELIQRIQGRS